MVSQAGIGIRYFWTWVGLRPLGAQKDVILNSVAPPTNLSPFNISGQQGSWVSELVWDRLMRIGPDGLPRPWAAETVARPDHPTVELTLRNGMKWQRRQAGDRRRRDVQPGGARRQRQGADVQAVRAEHRQASRRPAPISSAITLKRPDAAFLVSSLSKLNLAPKHIWGPILEDLKSKPQTAESIRRSMPIGSGPFRFVSVPN